MSIEKKPNKIITRILLGIIGFILRSRSKIRLLRDDASSIKPPYIILGNHVNNWDPFFVNEFVDEPISFIAANSLFFNPILRTLLNYIGIIPKSKEKSDIRTIRQILRAKRHERIIGIFPEGNVTWDGSYEKIDDSTAKLIKLLKIPVIVAIISGAHLSRPRWAKSHRRGKIDISFKKLFSEEDIKRRPIEYIHEKLNKALNHDEITWQERRQNIYKGRRLAQYLERLLFICPSCKDISSMHSRGSSFFCTHCGYSLEYTVYGKFKNHNREPYFSWPGQWNDWQLSELKLRLKDNNLSLEAFKDPVKLYVSSGDTPFKLISVGQIELEDAGIVFKGHKDMEYRFLFEDIKSPNIHMSANLNFYYGDKFYRFKFYKPRTSAYKWLNLIKILAP